jgi:magnesium transporter
MLELIRRKSKKADPVAVPEPPKINIEKRNATSRITIIDYDEAQFMEGVAMSVEELISFRYKPTVTWIKVEGIHQPEIMEQFSRAFDIHPLVMEDIVNTNQRPKMEDHGDYIFIVLKLFYFDEDTNELTLGQFSLIFSNNILISFEESGGDVFKLVKGRIKNERGRIRRLGTDYLAYVLLDTIVDNYFLILERLGDKIETLEEDLVTDPSQRLLKEIYELKNSMIILRKAVWPLREVIGSLNRCESPLVHESTGIYLRDLYDHTVQVIDSIEIFRETLAEMVSIHVSSISNRLNEIMKVLTVITTIFIPLTFIAGIFSMNFKYMPELDWTYGYPVSLILMTIVGIIMMAWFRNKDWL